MAKCVVDSAALKQIRAKVQPAIRMFRGGRLDTDAFKQKVLDWVNWITKDQDYDMSQADLIVDMAYPDIFVKYGLTQQFPDFFSKEHFKSLLTASDSNIQVNDTAETSTDNLVDTPQVRLKAEASRKFLDDAYGLAKEVQNYVINRTNRNLVDCLFVNRGSLNSELGVVSTTIQLNKNIRDYQQELLNRISSYLWGIVKVAPNLHISKDIKELLQNPVMYQEVNGEVQYTGILEKISQLTNMYLSPTMFNVDILRQIYNDSRSNTISLQAKQEAQQKLDAYNAMVILNHFDTYLTLTLGKVMKIQDFNKFTGKDKYTISSKTANLITTWRTEDNINVEDEIDGITRLIINTTPFMKWGSNVEVEGQFVHFSDFEHTVAKIKDLAFNENTYSIVFDDNFKNQHNDIWVSLSQDTREYLEGKRLSTAINLIRKNPRQYLHPIFDLLSNENFYRDFRLAVYPDFTRDELDKLYSISRGLFSGNNSLYEIAGQEFTTDYYSYLTQTVDGIFSVSYVQYYRDADGLLKVRTFIDQTTNNLRRGIEQSINNGNSKTLIKDYNQVISDLQIQRNPEDKLTSISFIIPNTNIRVSVNKSNGSVRIQNSETGQRINDFVSLWRNDDVRYFIDSLLKLGVADNQDFQNAIVDITGSITEMSNRLLSFASRVVLNQYISNTIIDGTQSIAHQLDQIKSEYGDSSPRYNYAGNEMGLVSPMDVPTLRLLANAKANYQGLTTASQVKDGEGNGQSMYTLSRLLGSLHSQWDLQERAGDSATRNSLLLTIPGLLEGVYTAKEYYSADGTSKSSVDMNVAEMSYAAIVNDFIKGLIPINADDDSDIVGDGHVLFLPSVNSDKSTIGRIRINLNKTVNSKKLIDYNINELEELIAQQFGDTYINSYNNIVEDWSRVDAMIAEEGITLPSLAKDFIYGFNNFNQAFNSNTNLVKRYKNPVNFIKTLVLNYNSKNRLHPFALIDQVHYKDAKGNLATNLTLISQIARFAPDFIRQIDPNILKEYPTARKFWTNKKAEVVKSLLKSNFKLNTTNNINQPELRYIRDKYPSWVNSSGDMVIAKLNIDGQLVNIASARDLIRITEGNIYDVIDKFADNLVLNPIIDRYNYMDYLFTQEFMNLTVGSFIAHPPKKAQGALGQEAAQFQAQHKRNVSMTASMHPFQLNLLNGIPEEYNIAVIDDIKDYQGTIDGSINEIKPFDGATFVNPFVVILENNSLGGAKAGITKKQFVHFKDERTGTGGIIKTAGFGITNEWMRNSPFIEGMMQQMTDHVWLNMDGSPAIIDITRDYKGNPIVYNNLFFKQNGKFYQMTRIDSLGNNQYVRTIHEVSPYGRIVGEAVIDQVPITVDTNYKLWNFFGGKNSAEVNLETGKLQSSNSSVENVVTAMNNIGTEIGNPRKIETQEQLWQPLKHSDIHYIPTAGAVKQGAANINPSLKYPRPGQALQPLDIQKIHMYQAGIQLDKEHNADEAELSLMTQVISACAAKGYTLDAAVKLYEALRAATEQGTKDHLEVVRQMFTDGTEESIENFQEVLMKSIIRAISSDTNVGNFAKKIADDLQQQAREGKTVRYADAMLPLSDNTLYAKMLSTITVYLTNTGIKQKIPGVLAVLTPSHNIQKLYAGRKYESFDNPEQELEELQSQQVPVFDVRYKYSPDMQYFAGLKIEYVPYGSLISNNDGKPVAASNHHDGIVRIDETLLKEKFEQKAWRDIRNSKSLNRDFSTYEEWKRFVLLHEAMHEVYKQLPGEEKFDYETRVNEQALNRFDNSISNLRLNRTYLITEIAEGPDGIPIELPPISKLIETPLQYRELKNKIATGQVTSVVEDVRVGRDLGSYNVYFKTVDETAFQMNDLDSVAALYELADLREHWSDDEKELPDQLRRLAGIYKLAFGQELTNLPTEEYSTFMNRMEVRIRRMQQSDLENLSPSGTNVVEQYNTFLQTRTDTQEWYNRYAQWVNIKLGRGHGSQLYLRGQMVRVTSQNFDQVQGIVANILDKTTKVKINGNYYSVDKRTLNFEPYEVIMPKIFATAFGLSEFDDLNSIASDRDYFIKQYLRNQAIKIAPEQYTVALKKSNGRHLYILSRDQVSNSGLHKAPDISEVEIDGKRYRQDQNQNIMYEITADTDLYYDDFGNEVLVTNDVNFYIDNANYDSIKLSENLLTRPSLVRTLVAHLKESPSKVARRYYRFVIANGPTAENIMQANAELNSVNESNYTQLDENNPIIVNGREKHTSFLKSLDIIAARIPSQSMQSFMPMKVVAFENPDINTAYVSTHQILLQGSDFDIDTVSLATYDIDNNGKLNLWSPYASLRDTQMMEASLNIPFPTGVTTEFKESDNLDFDLYFIDKYKDILSINESFKFNPTTKDFEVDPSDIELNLMLDTPEKIQKFIDLLRDVQFVTIPSESYRQKFAYEMTNRNLVTYRFQNPMQILKIFSKLKEVVDRHNLFFDKLNSSNISRIVNNYTMDSMYSVGIDPANRQQAETSVDGTTGPLKKIANNSDEGKEAALRTPGNSINKYQGIVENQTGKKGIGICAIGLKGFFGLTQYNNYILNHGTQEQQQRLLMGSGHKGHVIGGKVYKLLANIRTKDPNTLKDKDVMEALSQVTNDQDSALVLSALLSLATDNAKELALSKLNATTKTLGMYVYGISIGMEFSDLANIIMSPVGRTISQLLESNVFAEQQGFYSVDQVFKYFDEGPTRILYNFDIHRDPSGDTINTSPLKRFTKYFEEETGKMLDKDGNPLSITQRLAVFAKSNVTLQEKLNTTEKFRQFYAGQTTYEKEVYNQLLDFVQDYIRQADVIGKSPEIYNDLKELSEGAQEMRTLGAILSLNQGLKTDQDSILRQISLIENALKERGGDHEVDLTKFAFDEKYRQQIIEEYEDVKHSFNIYDVISTIPHFMGYLQTLAIAYEELKGSYKFRSVKELTPKVAAKIGLSGRTDKVAKGIQNFIGDYLRNNWMLQSDIIITIPKGTKAFDSNGNQEPLKEDIPIRLGTDWGNATFRVFMEGEIIPNLKKGIIKVGMNQPFSEILNNKFLQDLGNDLLTNTVSRNPSIVYTLPINMMPRVDQERAIFNSYKSQFNKLAKYSYQYQTTSYDSNGNPVTTEQSIPLLDLFTYYAMIADGWKMGEKSLVPILEDFKSSGRIKEFLDFEAAYDKSGQVLTEDRDFDFNNLLPYVVPFQSPYSAYTKYTQYRNPSTKKYQLMRKLSGSELRDLQESNNEESLNGLVSGFQYLSTVDTNYFQSGTIQPEIKTIESDFGENEDHLHIEITYNIEKESIEGIRYNDNSINPSDLELSKVPTIKVDGIRKVDMELLNILIRNKLKPC